MSVLHHRRRLRTLLLAIPLVALLFSSSFMFLIQTASAQTGIIDAQPYLDSTRPDYGIQAALDAAAAAGGGTVQLPSGRFPLETYLQLRSGVTLKGQGASTVLAAGRNEQRVFITASSGGNTTNVLPVSDVTPLRVGMIVFVWRSTALNYKPESYEITAISAGAKTITLDRNVSFPLMANVSQVSFGLYTKLTATVAGRDTLVKTIQVADPTFVTVGEAIMIKSDSNGADPFLNPAGGEGTWGVETNIVEAIDVANRTLTLRNDITVNAYAGTVVFHAYGGVFAQGVRANAVRVANIGVKDLAIEGWNTAEKPAFYEFYIGAINLVYCDRAIISNVIVRYWHSDGISLQTCNNSTIADSSSNQNRGHGFHPGTGSNYLEFVRVTAIGNLGFTGRGTAGDGLYYCWANQYVNIRQSIFSDNAGAGVGDMGGGDTNNTFYDYNNLIEDSVMERNGKSGIEITGGSAAANTFIQRNTVRNNNRLNAGHAGITISAKKGHAQRFTIAGNLVESTASTPTQLVGILETNPNASYAADYNIIRDNVVRNHGQANIVTVGANTTLSNNSSGVAVTSFSLYNADTDQPIAGFNPLPANATLNFATLGTRNLAIRAFTNPSTVGSVRFILDGASYRMENTAPYLIAGDASSTDYNAWTPSLGAHTLTGVAYSSYGGGGQVGPEYTITFTVIDQPGPTPTSPPAPPPPTSQPTASPTATQGVPATATSRPTASPTALATATAQATATSQPTASPTATQGVPATATSTPLPTLQATPIAIEKNPVVGSLNLYNADTDLPIAGFAPLQPNAMLRFSNLGTRNLSIVVNTNPSTVGSTSFRLDGVLIRVENSAPFAIQGDTNGTDYNAWTPTVGTHTLQVVAYSGANQTGSASATYSLTFTVSE
jgi:hypothetical protein